jgi:hypothetical protein
MTRGALALIAAASLLACPASAKHEAATLLAAVERYQRAGNSSKAAEVQSLAGVVCTDTKVCGAKRTCLAAIEPIARALTLKDDVQRGIADIEQKRLSPDSPEARTLPGKLDEAEKLLDEGRANLPACEKELTDLRLVYGV